MKIKIYLFLLPFVCITSAAKEMQSEFFGVSKQTGAPCEYLEINAPAGWVISELKLQAKDHSRPRIVRGGVWYAQVLLREGAEEGISADILFTPQKRAPQFSPNFRLSTSVHKENCYMGKPAGKVTEKIGESLTPSKTIVKTRNAGNKSSKKMGIITYKFAA